MNIDSVVIATFVGPVAAVIVTRVMDGLRESRNKKMWIFSTLMSLRGAHMHPDHVRALNVIQVDFHKDKDVIEAWRDVVKHYEKDTAADGWAEQHRDYLQQLHLAMAKALNVRGKEIDLKTGGYYPKGWADQEFHSFQMRQFLQGVAKGERAVPIEVRSPS